MSFAIFMVPATFTFLTCETNPVLIITDVRSRPQDGLLMGR